MSKTMKYALGAIVASSLLLAAAIVLSVNPVRAADAPKWTGVYAGASLGYAATTTTADLGITGLGNVATVDGFGASGHSLGVVVGADLQIERFVIGAFADWTKHDQEWSAGSPLIGGTLASLKIEDSWTIGARAGITVGNGLIYGLVGYTTLSTGDLNIPLVPVSFSVPDFKGWTLGGGAEMALGGGLFAGLEYRYTEFDRETINLIPAVADLGLEPTVSEVKARIVYKFGFDAPSLK